MTPEEKICAICTEKKLTLAVAESCTGGRVASRLTKVPGTSRYFLGSVVAYAPLWKEKMLGVSTRTLAAKGAASVDVAKEMVRGLLGHTTADVALAITGEAGPEASSSMAPVGAVHIALLFRGKSPQTHSLDLRGGREEILQKATDEALRLLQEFVQ
jgi:nicotinamide-nucleotide amidase